MNISFQLLKFIFFNVMVANSIIEPARGAVGGAVLNGNWANVATWSFGGVNRLPTCGDTVAIPAGLDVTVNSQVDYSACATPIYVIVGGTLLFTNGNKLQLPCNSTVNVLAGGLIRKSTPGGGNSTFIEICEVVEWKAGDGDLHGPVILGGNALPISLLSFDAVPKEKTVELNWITATEINNDYFTIERSVDGENYHVVSYVQGAGNSSMQIEYIFTDTSPISGVSYYRLKQTDYDGTYSYSPIVAVQLTENHTLNLISVIPHGASLNLFMENEVGKKIVVSVIDMKGVQIEEQELYIHKEKSFYPIDLPGLSTGIYIVALIHENGFSSRKFIF